MTGHGEFEDEGPLDEFEGLEDAEEGDEDLVTEGDIRCPHCGEINAVTLDPGGGKTQEYVEDCQVCCRPWTVHVQYDADGGVEVWAEAAYE
ncbi:MAG TPA: CPXCG motif-containing cysteine-rich protein [Gemmatimonadales bacterium]|nr:CPXCG motif-containing cysteine-rich protein [Gemmatimonadales bacterium]